MIFYRAGLKVIIIFVVVKLTENYSRSQLFQRQEPGFVKFCARKEEDKKYCGKTV